VKDFLPFVIFMVVIVGLLLFSARARRRQAATQAQQAASIDVGSDVMTTSGLYGTVVARNDDETVQMSIAAGVEVKWALAALRDIQSLPPQYRTDAERDGDPSYDADDPAGRPRIQLDKPRSTDNGGADPNA
jgi:preprotein translocase subunit YajC